MPLHWPLFQVQLSSAEQELESLKPLHDWSVEYVPPQDDVSLHMQEAVVHVGEDVYVEHGCGVMVQLAVQVHPRVEQVLLSDTLVQVVAFETHEVHLDPVPAAQVQPALLHKVLDPFVLF